MGVIDLRIKKISNDKIVVQLTDSDLEYFDVDIDNATPQSTDLHKFLFEVMELVKSETGFDPYNGGQVVVEAAMSQNGMSLTISKIRTGNSSITREQFNKAKKVTVKSKECVSHTDTAQLAECSGIRKRKSKKNASCSTVFVFDSFSDFEKAVCVSDFDFGDALLYRDKSRYALIYPQGAGMRKYNVLSEYALKTRKNDVFADSIRECWTAVASEDTLFEMTENLRKMNYL